MTNIHDFTTVHCAYDHVPERLRAYFHGDTGLMPLVMKVGDLRVEHDVELRITDRPDYPGYKNLTIGWKPKDGGPYPTFAGTLSVSDEGVGWSRVELDGNYEPPLGALGAVFDAAVGHHIAQATATELLAELKRILSAAA